jgi:hypothetical protein
MTTERTKRPIGGENAADDPITKLRDAAGHVSTLARVLPALNRRAAIKIERDGYPARASGAQRHDRSVTEPPDPRLWIDHASAGVGWACPVRDCPARGTAPSDPAARVDYLAHHREAHRGERTAGHADPTGTVAAELADGAGARDVFDRDYRRVTAELERVTERLERLANSAAALHDPRVDAVGDDIWCVSCTRVKHLAPRRAAGGDRCDWCYTTLRVLNKARSSKGLAELKDLPARAIRHHAEGKRVTEDDLHRWASLEETGTQRRDGRKGKRKR